MLYEISIRVGRVVLLLVVIAGVVPETTWACSPAPCIEATPNPVVVALGETQGTTVVDWDATGLGGTISVTEETTASAETVLAMGAVGNLARPILLNEKYTFRLRSGPTLVASVDVEAKPAGRPQAGVFGDVSISRIPQRPEAVRVAPIKVLFARHGTWISFGTQTRDERNLFSAVTNSPTVGCDYDDADLVTVGASNKFRTRHGQKLYNLEPSTQYNLFLKMRTRSGQVECHNSAFQTLGRAVTLRVKSVRMIDDSDDLSAGDMRFAFFVNPRSTQPFGDQVRMFPSSGEVDLDTGTSFDIDPDVVLNLGGAESVSFNVTGSDDDELRSPGVLSRCGQLMTPRDGPSSSDCSDINGKTVSLFFGPDAPGQEEVSREFEVKALGGALEFAVTVRFDVTYQ